MTDMTPREAVEVLQDVLRCVAAKEHVPLRTIEQSGQAITTLSALADRAGEWIPIETGGRLPAIGEWVSLLTDTHAGPRPDLLPFLTPRPRFAVIPAQLRHVDDEGCPIWQRWELASGHPCGRIEGDTHWQQLPAAPGASHE